MTSTPIRLLLLIEDSAGDARLFKEMLADQGSKGTELVHVETMSDAEKYLADNLVDIVLLDLSLPDVQGLETVRRARAASRMAPLVVLTGLDDELMAAQAMREGAADYLIKGQLERRGFLRSLRYAIDRRSVESALLSEKERAVTAQGAAERANTAKSRFLATMSHELRTPLSGILGYAQLLRLEGELSAVQASRVDAMLSAGTHLMQMINGVLDLSQIEAGRLELQMGDVDARKVAHSALELVQQTALARGLALHGYISPKIPDLIVADSTRLQQILLNLLGNAVKFTTRGSVKLWADVRPEDGKLLIKIADTGPGVPAEYRERMFKDFERFDNAATSAAEGAGLGLALSARLAALMGGQLGYEDNPGGGSIFWLELPLEEGSSATRHPLETAAHEDGARKSLTVLVVDDVDMNRDIARSFLLAGGHTVVCADGGAAAVEAARGADFDLILMDVRMPGMDGLEATRRIRAFDNARGRVPIVALTAQAFAEQTDACRSAGMDDHLSKPFTMESLLEAVARAVRTRESGSVPAFAPPCAA